MTGLRLGARLWWGYVPLVLLLWGAGALASVSFAGIPGTPAAVLALVPAAAFARTVAVAIAVGSVAIQLMTSSPRVRRWAVGWCATAAALALLAFTALRAEIGEAALQSLAGRALLVQSVGLLLAALLCLLGRPGASTPRVAMGAALALAVAAAAAPGVAGHAGLSGPHAAAALSIGLHAVAASLWVGGLAVVVALLVLEPGEAPSVLPRYSAMALACVIVLAEAGLLTATLVGGGATELLGTTYGSLVLAKAVLLGWLVLLGWRQRRRAVDRLPDASVARTVAVLAAGELLLMGTAFAAATVMARIGPSSIPGTGFAPLTLIVLGLGLPMLVVVVRPRGWRIADAAPEAAAVLLLVVLVEVGGVGLIRVVIGPVGLVVETLLLAGAGWWAMSATRQGGWGLLVLAAGLPVAMAAATILDDRPAGWPMAIVATVSGEALVGLWWRRAASTARTSPADGVLLAGS